MTTASIKTDADFAMFQRRAHDSQFRLVEVAPGVTIDKIASKTTAGYLI